MDLNLQRLSRVMMRGAMAAAMVDAVSQFAEQYGIHSPTLDIFPLDAAARLATTTDDDAASILSGISVETPQEVASIKVGRLKHKLDQSEAKIEDLGRKLKRVENGDCPCCNRYFKNLHRHMKSGHKRKGRR